MFAGSAPLTFLGMTVHTLARRPMRTALTTLGVAVGVVAIVSLTCIVRGLWRSIETSIHLHGGDMMVYQANVTADIFSALDEERTRARLMRIPQVERAVGALSHALPSGHLRFCVTVGMRFDDMNYITSRRENLVRGRRPQAEDEIVVGSIAAKILKRDVGDPMVLGGREFHVVGVFHSDVAILNGGVVVSLPTLQEMSGKDGQVTLFQLFLKPGASAADVADRIERENPDLAAVTSASEYSKVDEGLQVANGLVAAVSLVVLIIGSVIVANTMWMSVLERTRQIGVLRAVGWSRRRIIAMIVLEAAGVGLVACVIGSVLGIGLAQLTTVLPFTRQFVEPVFDAVPFVQALAVALLLSVLGALLPAWRAARISPATALRYE